ncbi:MAG: MFS transporter [Armatimonadota bacterium]
MTGPKQPSADAARKPGRDLRRELLIFLVVASALGMTSGIFETTFNNYLSDTFSITAGARGRLEFPREFPGFLVTVVGGALFFLSEVRLGLVATLGIALGLLGLAFVGDRYALMVVFMFLWSAGAHLMMPVSSTIQLSLAERNNRAAMMGRIGAFGLVATIVGAGIVWTGLEYIHLSYRAMFLIAMCGALTAAVFVSRLRPLPRRPGARPKLVIKRRYSLFYLLYALAGARKQVFITFGPWVLIKVFGEPAPTIAKLWIVASAIGIFVQPQLGKLIDRVGERAILMADGLILIVVCACYGFAEHLTIAHPVRLVYACYVLDNLLFATTIARATYIDKIAEKQSDVHASLSLGVSIDHAVSMSIPWLGGRLWDSFGYPYVFLAAAVIAVMSCTAASFVRVPRGHVDATLPLPTETLDLPP